MFFNKKKKAKAIRCDNCSSKLNKEFSFCPYCGEEIYEDEKNPEDFGMLGEDDEIEEESKNDFMMSNLGITDKIFSSLVNNLTKSLARQMSEFDSKANKPQIKTFPNGISIMIGRQYPGANNNIQSSQKPKQAQKKELSGEQLEKLSKLPRASAKTQIKRLSDRIIYELSVPGIKSQDDIFISKLESGYEIKAVGEKKIYSNVIPLNLPIRNLSLINSSIIIEFPSQAR